MRATEQDLEPTTLVRSQSTLSSNWGAYGEHKKEISDILNVSNMGPSAIKKITIL